MEIKMDNFYEQLARRPRLDLVIEEAEKEFWNKTFEGSNEITMYSWARNGWIENLRDNIKHFGYFNRDHSVKIYANELVNSPVILVGAGPSLALNIEGLKLAKEKKIPIMCSSHALMYLADLDIKPDFVVMLDAGKMWDDYLNAGEMDMSDVPLIADQVCDPAQLKTWKGPVKFFKAAAPMESKISQFVQMEMNRLVPVRENASQIEVGGHVMGAMLSLARGIFASNNIIFVGADYCSEFNPTGPGKFYPFEKKIDQIVNTENPDGSFSDKPAAPVYDGQAVDIFNRTVFTNGSYLGFKNVIDSSIKQNKMASNPVEDLDFINATEGGLLGSLKGGLSKFMLYMRLQDAIFYSENKRIAKGG